MSSEAGGGQGRGRGNSSRVEAGAEIEEEVAEEACSTVPTVDS